MSDQHKGMHDNPPSLNWEQTIVNYPFMKKLSENAKVAWNGLSRESQEAHVKQLEGLANENYRALRVGTDWQPIQVSAMGQLPSEILFKMLEYKGCELKQDGNKVSGWAFRKKV